MRILGIDLGTTHTVASIEGYVHPIAQEGRTTLPSVVAFLPSGTTQIGEVASRRRSIDVKNTIYSSKRIIGRRFDDSRTREFRHRYPFEMVRERDDEPAFKTRAGLYTPTNIATMLLAEVYDQIKHLAWGLDTTVVTVPAAFGPGQRAATVAAARKTGLGHVELADEPMATACAYMAQPGRVSTAAVYDLGGGTFDFAVVDCTQHPPRLLAHASDLFLGGDDVDRKIADWAAERVLEQWNWDLRNYAEVEGRLLAESERAKIRLATAPETVLDLSQVDPDCPATAQGLPLSRDILDALCRDLVQRTFVLCDSVLRDAGLRPDALDDVFLSGGSTHLPQVQRCVESYFGRPGRREIEPTEVVAIGASLVRG